MTPRFLAVLALVSLAASSCESHPDVAFADPTPLPAAARTPVMAYANPADGATAVLPTEPLIVVFSTSMNPTTINTSTLVLSSGGEVVATTVTYSGFTAKVQPTAPLSYLGQYSLDISADVEASSGVPLGEDVHLGFGTADIQFPMFKVQKSNGQVLPVSNKLVTWDLVVLDDMGDDTSYGWGVVPNAYVVPVTGWWRFDVSLEIEASAGDRIFVALGTDGTDTPPATWDYLFLQHADSTAPLAATGSTILYAAQGQIVSVLARSEVSMSATSTEYSFNRFHGQLIRR